MTARPERRQRQKMLRKTLAEIEQRGIPLPARMEHVAALALGFSDRLAQRSSANPAIEAAEYRHRLYELSVAKAGGLASAECKKGCCYCCKAYVSALPPDIFAVAKYVSARGRLEIDRVIVAEAITHGQDLDRRMATRDPCALLNGDACGVYAKRPIPCRAFNSRSVEACRIFYEGGPDNIPALEMPKLLRAAVQQAMFAALRNLGIADISYELNHAVVVALTTENAESRWLAGEDVFAAVSRDPGSAIRGPGTAPAMMLDKLVAVCRGEIPFPQ